MKLTEWLSDLDLGQYASNFADNDVDFEILGELTSDDLREMGISSVGHRRKILAAAQSLGATANAAPLSPVVAKGASPDRGERRHLTVMFVDLVGSTEMSTQLDPEDWRRFMTTYQDTVAGVVARYEGFIAQFLGDGVLCYFGWPRASENDAERSVRAALEIVSSVRNLTHPGAQKPSSRIGIASGLVVVGDLIGSNGVYETSAIGETPNLAARLQGLAKPDEIILPPATRELLGNVFNLRNMGEQSLRGMNEPIETYSVISENIKESRFEALKAGELTPIVGRSDELDALRASWQDALGGQGRMVLMVGEAGIGKSRLVQAARDAASETNHVETVFQCSPYHKESAFYPILQQMTAAAGITPTDSNVERLDKLAALSGITPENIVLFAPLMGIDASEQYGELTLTLAQQRARTMQAMADRLFAIAKETPSLIIFEDLHWADPTTLEFLDKVVGALANDRILLLSTARPSFTHAFKNGQSVSILELQRLANAQTIDIISKIAKSKSVPKQVIDLILDRTDGVPLFVEELTKTVLERGVLKEVDDAYILKRPLDVMAIPNTLQDSLMARLDRMDKVKEVAQMASCIGREFSHSLISKVSSLSEENLENALQELSDAELIYRQKDSVKRRYMFKHALVRDAAYESLLKGNRKGIHKSILDALGGEPDAAPEVLAVHAEAAQLTDRAIDLWEVAGNVAVSRPAFDEGIAHFGRAIALLEPKVASDDRSAIEKTLPMLVKQGVASMARKGWGNDDTKASFERALMLDERLGRTPMRVSLIYGLMATRLPRGELNEAVKHGPDFVSLAEAQQESAPAVVANRSFGISLTFKGEFTRAEPFLDRAVELFDPEIHANMAAQWGQDLGIATYAVIAFTKAMLGKTRDAFKLFETCQFYGSICDDVNSNAYRHMNGTMFQTLMQNDDALFEHAHAMAELAAEYNLSYFAQFAAMNLAIIKVGKGDRSALDEFLRIDAQCERDKSTVNAPMMRIEMARRVFALGMKQQAHKLLDMTDDIIARSAQAMCFADLHRARAEFVASEGDFKQAEQELKISLEIAQKQGAKLYELRAAIDLAKIWDKTGNRAGITKLLGDATHGIADGDCPTEMAQIHKLKP